VDDTMFAAVDDAPWPDDVDLPAPVAGFVGHVSERIDLALLEAVADRGISLLLVGPRIDFPALDHLLARPQVRAVGPKPFAALASYLRAIDVGLTPYADTEFNRGSFPLKTLEYLAAGRPVVATDLPALRALGTDLITLTSNAAEFADAVSAAAARPRTPTAVAARRAVATRNSWDVRAAQVAGILGLPDPTRADAPTTRS
jgi:teichuronic acid biosynthesis glycosyltransferase TuaH